MKNGHSTDSSFWIRCVGYNQSTEAYFTIGKEYEVRGGRVTNDNGYTYTNYEMKPGSDPASWFLYRWYKFEIVDDATVPDHLDISFEEALGLA